MKQKEVFPITPILEFRCELVVDSLVSFIRSRTERNNILIFSSIGGTPSTDRFFLVGVKSFTNEKVRVTHYTVAPYSIYNRKTPFQKKQIVLVSTSKDH